MTREPVIVDTNVMIGALPTANGEGPYAAILRAMLACEQSFVLSAALAREYRAVLTRRALLARHRHGEADVDALLQALAQRARWIEPTADAAQPVARAPERGDQMLWDLLASEPTLRLVTEDAALRRDRTMRARVIGADTLLAELSGPPLTCVAPALIAAYRRTRYRVHSQPETILRIDAPSPELTGLYAAHQVQAAAFVTACNPLGQPLSPPDNALRMQALGSALQACGLPSIPGAGEDPDGHWPAEASDLVLGIDLHAACDIGRMHDQNAIVWAGSDAVPRLVLLR
jgi:predicted nucleic acid-binding protein